MTHIVKCKIENIIGVKKVEFEPNGHSVTIGGANGEGKSSTMTALVMALAGKIEIPKMPVHFGADVGKVELELKLPEDKEQLSVYLEVDANRETRLVVTNKEGKKLVRPQSILDNFFRNLAFDPGAFRSQDREKRFHVLTELLGVDPSDLEKDQEEKYKKRTEVGRDITTLQGKLDGRSFHADAPAEEIDITGSLQKLTDLHSVSRLTTSLKSNAAIKETEAQQLTEKNVRNVAEIERLMKEITRLTDETDHNKLTISAYMKEASDIREKIKDMEANDDSKAQAEKLDAQLKDFEVTNQKVRENKDTLKLREELKGLTNLKGALTAEINDIDIRLQQMIANAKTPIPGLKLTRGSVYYNETPFEQISESEQWEVSTAIGFAINPTGIVFMRNCGGLDKKSRERVRARAAELGVQLFLEVVDDADDVQILIEEGKVKENRLKKTKEISAHV